MDEQGKRLLLALAIVAGMWLVYMTFFGPKPRPKKEAETAAETDAGPKTAAPTPTPATAGQPGQPTQPGQPAQPGVKPAEPPAPKCDPATADKKEIDQDRWVARFSACNGALASFVLK